VAFLIVPDLIMRGLFGRGAFTKQMLMPPP